MADRAFTGILHALGGRVRVVTCLILAAGSSVNIINTQGVVIEHPLVAGVVRNSAGNYTITLRDNYRAHMHASATYNPIEENVDLYAQLGAITLGPTPATVVIRLKTGTANTDPSATGGVISVLLVFEDSDAYVA